MDVIAIASNASLREDVSAWIAGKQVKRYLEPAPQLQAPPAECSAPVLPPPSASSHSSVTGFMSPSPSTRSARHSSVFTPVDGTSLTGTLKQEPSADITAGVLRAAVMTAEGFASPKERWKKIFNTFKAVKGMGPSEKQTVAFQARLEGDPSLATARATEIEVRDGSTLLHAAAAWGNLNAVKHVLP